MSSLEWCALPTQRALVTTDSTQRSDTNQPDHSIE
jgi:hypothetical protein